MADRVLLRSGTALAPPGFMRPGELAYSPQDFRLWIADGSGTAQAAYTGGGGGVSGLTSFQGRATAAAVLTSGDVIGALGYTPSGFDGAYASLTGKPVLFDGTYASLTGKPVLFDGTYASLTGKPGLATVATTGAYADLTGKPALAAVATTGAYADVTGKPTFGGAAALNVGTTTGTVAAGDDARFGAGGASLAVAGTDPVPVIDGTAAVGTSTKAAREDHVHPTDTTRAARANNLSDLASAATARTNLGVSAFCWDVGFDQGAVVANGTVTIVRKAPFPCTINSLDYEVGSAGGSFTVAVQIAGVSVTGLSAVAVSSSTSANAAASGANAVAAGQAVTLVISSVTGSPTGANLQINGTR